MIRRILMLVGCCLAVAGFSAAQVNTTSRAASLAATTASQPARICAGKVVDADEKPLAGATVQLYQWDNDKDEPKILEEMTTKQDGAFSFPWPGGDDPNANGGVVARKAGLAIGFDKWHSQTFETTGLVIKLGKPAAMSGVVVDEAGSPVARAEVMPCLQVADPGHYRYVRGNKWVSARTDAKGEFRIENLPADARAELEVSAAGRATIMTRSQSGIFTYAAGETDIRITLPAEAKVEGAVVDAATSRPVAGVKLRAAGIGMPGATTVTDNDGRFSLGRLTGRVAIALAPADPATGAMDWLADSVSVTTEAGKTSNVTIPVSKGGLIEVLVTDPTGRAVVRCHVTVGLKDAAQASAGCWTGRDGIARIRVKPGKYALADVYAEGYLRTDRKAAPPQSVSVEEGQTARLTVQLQPLPTLRGVVKDKDGKPVAGASVWIRFGNAVVTGPDGSFELKLNVSGPGEAGPTEVLARHAELGLAGVAEVQDVDKPMELKLASGATLAGKVTDTDGKPIRNAQLRLSRSAGRFAYSVSQLGLPRTDADGRYEIKAIPPGSYWVSATADGFGESQARFSVAEGQTEAIEKSFALPETKLSVAGVVVDMDDKPVAGASVSVHGQGQPNRQAQTDAAGKFVIEKVVSTTVELQANAESQGKRLYGLGVKAKGGDKDVRIVLNMEADETGRIRRIAGEGARRLVGKPLPKLEPFGLKPAAELAAGKRLLVCFWDMEQRPSRRAIQMLNEKAAELAKKGVVVVAIEATGGDEKQLHDWASTNKVALPLGLVGAEKDKVAKTLATWGVAGLPWLILTDDKHVVAAEGLTLEQIGEALAAPTTRPAAGGQ